MPRQKANGAPTKTRAKVTTIEGKPVDLAALNVTFGSRSPYERELDLLLAEIDAAEQGTTPGRWYGDKHTATMIVNRAKKRGGLRLKSMANDGGWVVARDPDQTPKTPRVRKVAAPVAPPADAEAEAPVQ